jgi:hypothetical protein
MKINQNKTIQIKEPIQLKEHHLKNLHLKIMLIENLHTLQFSQVL